jgi:hypothetical protein
MSYGKAQSDELTSIIHDTDAKRIDVTDMPPEQQARALRALVAALETGLHIVMETHYRNGPAREPFPGACKAVVEQGLAGIALARNSGLIPYK